MLAFFPLSIPALRPVALPPSFPAHPAVGLGLSKAAGPRTQRLENLQKGFFGVWTQRRKGQSPCAPSSP